MIKEKDMREMRPQIRFQNGTEITLETIKNALQDCADRNGVPVAFYSDEIKYGGLIGGSVEPCIVLYHPEHQKDYFNAAIKVKYQGNYAFVNVYDFGTSTQLGNLDTKNYLKDTIKNGTGAEKVGALLGAGIRRIVKGGSNKQKLEEESNWYSMVEDLFNEIIS